MANNRTCIVCEKQYEYCSSCNKKNIPVWKNLFHDENCKDIFRIVSDFANGVASKEVSKHKLNQCNLANSNGFRENVKRYIDEICNEVVVYDDKITSQENTYQEKAVSKKRTNRKTKEKFDM